MKVSNPDIEKIELTEEEIKAAIYEAKVKKWFHEKSKDYWEMLERIDTSPEGQIRRTIKQLHG